LGGKWEEDGGFAVVNVEADEAEADGEATFLKVIVHLSSSPAKTTCSCQRTKTRMLVLVMVGGPSGDMVKGGRDNG
jgi:hypothetical protein